MTKGAIFPGGQGQEIRGRKQVLALLELVEKIMKIFVVKICKGMVVS